MLARINLPREAILVSALAQVLLGFLVRLRLACRRACRFRIALPITAVLFPLGILSLVLVGFVVGVLLTPLGLLYNDVQQTLPVLTTFLMLLTPVVYPPPASGFAATVIALNPLTPLVSATRDWLTVGSTAHLGLFLAYTTVAFALLFAGWVVFRVAMPHLIARFGS